jgi:SpoVK/Ycf46/Vps4 family AAA+-type ATPase
VAVRYREAFAGQFRRVAAGDSYQAGQLGAKFITVGLADVLEMWVGQSERNLREIFQ